MELKIKVVCGDCAVSLSLCVIWQCMAEAGAVSHNRVTTSTGACPEVLCPHTHAHSRDSRTSFPLKCLNYLE